MYVDSHCHLEMESYDADRESVISKSLEAGLQYMLTVGTEAKYFETVMDLVNTYEAIYGAIGIHPHNSAEYDANTIQKIREYARHEKIVGYGEIGLDFFKNYAPREVQTRAFAEQLVLARELKLPIIIHSRNAPEETVNILRDVYGNGDGVIHCYSYDMDYVKIFLDMGFYISIPGTITYKKNEELVRVVKYIPEDRLLSETDAPFLTPHPHRGKRNVPHYVKLTVDKIAQIRGRDAARTAVSIRNNFESLFLNNLSGKAT